VANSTNTVRNPHISYQGFSQFQGKSCYCQSKDKCENAKPRYWKH